MLIKVLGLGFIFCMAAAIGCIVIDYNFVTRIKFSELAIGLIIVAFGCEVGFMLSLVVYFAKWLLGILGVM